jgi:spore coat protein U-like protein
MTRKLAVAAAVLALGFAADSLRPAYAGSASTSFTPTATVAKICSISSPAALSFGAYDPTAAGAKTGTLTLTVSCTRNTPATIALDNGGRYGTATGFATKRAMATGGGVAANGELLAYDLFEPDNVTAWGGANTVAVATQATKLTGATFTVNGSIPALQDVTSGTFTDSVNATINF